MSDEKYENQMELVVPSVPKIDKFIIIITKDIKEDEVKLLKEYGKLILFDDKVYHNLPLSSIDFDYLIMDLRKREDRNYLQQIDYQKIEHIHLISICHSFEKFDEYHQEIGVHNILTKLPDRQAFKADFNRLLLLRKISKPSVTLSCFKSFIRLVKGDWK